MIKVTHFYVHWSETPAHLVELWHDDDIYAYGPSEEFGFRAPRSWMWI